MSLGKGKLGRGPTKALKTQPVQLLSGFKKLVADARGSQKLVADAHAAGKKMVRACPFVVAPRTVETTQQNHSHTSDAVPTVLRQDHRNLGQRETTSGQRHPLAPSRGTRYEWEEPRATDPRRHGVAKFDVQQQRCLIWRTQAAGG